MVVVSINHRLNVLGFTYLAEFGGPDFAKSGDVGMLDIVHALRWVRQNIEHFGGDPNTVTIFGQSGGGRKVGTLLAMPSAKGLFHRAIIESGPTMTLVEQNQATKVASELLAKLGLNKSQVRELQSLPVDRIMSAYFAVTRSMNVDQMTMGFSPAVDGKALPRHPFAPTASECPRRAADARLDAHGADFGRRAAAFSLNESGLHTRIQTMLGDHASHVIDVYQKANPGASPSDIYFLIASDNRYGAPVMKIAERRAALQKGPVYLYYFRWETPLDGGRLKSPHTIEIPFAFDNIKTNRMTKKSRRAGPRRQSQQRLDRVRAERQSEYSGCPNGQHSIPKIGPPWSSTTKAGWRTTPSRAAHRDVQRNESGVATSCVGSRLRSEQAEPLFGSRSNASVFRKKVADDRHRIGSGFEHLTRVGAGDAADRHKRKAQSGRSRRNSSRPTVGSGFSFVTVPKIGPSAR